jgi:hypothetical protein
MDFKDSKSCGPDTFPRQRIWYDSLLMAVAIGVWMVEAQKAEESHWHKEGPNLQGSALTSVQI